MPHGTDFVVGFRPGIGGRNELAAIIDFIMAVHIFEMETRFKHMYLSFVMLTVHTVKTNELTVHTVSGLKRS